MGSRTAWEIATQPDLWLRAAEAAAGSPLPVRGAKVAIVGCGTSWFVAQSYAQLRERAGHGVTDAFTATEAFLDRGYDHVVYLSRSGTTTEVVELAAADPTRSTLITAVADGPVAPHVDDEIVLDYADEESVVQTRFATSALALLRASLGEDLTSAAADARTALAAPIDPAWIEADQITFLGLGWTVGLALEAALKCREASQAWTEAYSAMEYRHGPISIAQPGRLVWMFGEPPAGLVQDVTATGAAYVHQDLDPMAQLVLAQRLAVVRAEARDLDPDTPRSLTRSVILANG